LFAVADADEVPERPHVDDELVVHVTQLSVQHGREAARQKPALLNHNVLGPI
jgi:hypothetical protein